MADDDWSDDDVPIQKSAFWQPSEPTGPTRGGRRPPRPKNSSDKRLIFQVSNLSYHKLHVIVVKNESSQCGLVFNVQTIS